MTVERVIGLSSSKEEGFKILVARVLRGGTSERTVAFPRGLSLTDAEVILSDEGVDTSYLDPHLERNGRRRVAMLPRVPKFSLPGWQTRSG